jgi:hypothetical protein
MPAFIEALPQGANANLSMGVRISKGFPHLLDQLADFSALRFGIGPQNSR